MYVQNTLPNINTCLGDRINEIVVKTCSFSYLTQSPDAINVYAVGSDKTVKHLSSSRIVQEIDLHSFVLSSICLSNNGKTLVSGSTSGAVQLFSYPLRWDGIILTITQKMYQMFISVKGKLHKLSQFTIQWESHLSPNHFPSAQSVTGPGQFRWCRHLVLILLNTRNMRKVDKRHKLSSYFSLPGEWKEWRVHGDTVNFIKEWVKLGGKSSYYYLFLLHIFIRILFRNYIIRQL